MLKFHWIKNTLLSSFFDFAAIFSYLIFIQTIPILTHYEPVSKYAFLLSTHEKCFCIVLNVLLIQRLFFNFLQILTRFFVTINSFPENLLLKSMQNPKLTLAHPPILHQAQFLWLYCYLPIATLYGYLHFSCIYVYIL